MPVPRGGRYTATAIALHWLVAVLVIAMIAFGWWMQEIPKTPVGPRADAYNLHKSIGMSVLLLMFVRVLWRTAHPPPRLPPMPLWQARTARFVHVLLYVCLFVQPLSGYLGSAYSGYPVKFFGLALLTWAPNDAAVKDAMSLIHLGNSWLLVTAFALHLAGSFKHALIDRDGSFRRMWPWAGPARDPAGKAASA